MAKLNISDFDYYRFENELASTLFHIAGSQVKITLKCVVKPVTNDVWYCVSLAWWHMDYKVERFVFLEDAIIYYNNKLEEIEGEKYET